MLNEAEVKELNKLSVELREKVEAMFSSPYYLGFEALSSQFQAYCNELKEKPFTIETNEDFSKYAEFDNSDRIIMAISSAARAKAETALKISKEIPDMAEAIVGLQMKLSPDEQKKIGLITTTADIRKIALNGE
jgi:hypothetical protein